MVDKLSKETELRILGELVSIRSKINSLLSCWKHEDITLVFTTISNAGFSVRTTNLLLRNGIRTVHDITALTSYDLLNLHGVGAKISSEILLFLSENKLKLQEHAEA